MKYYKMNICYSWNDLDYDIHNLPNNYNFEAKDSVWNINELQPINFNPNLAFKIHSKVQKYDILDAYSGLSVVNSFFVSEKLHQLLQILKLPKLQIIKTKATYKKKEYPYYYYHFLEELSFKFDFINFDRTIFEATLTEEGIKRNITKGLFGKFKVSSWQELRDLINKYPIDNFGSVKKIKPLVLHLNKPIIYDLIYMDLGLESYYIISQKAKNIFESHKILGIGTIKEIDYDFIVD